MLRKELFDAIVCDPPYGIRATKKVKTEVKETIPEGLNKRPVEHELDVKAVEDKHEKAGLEPIILSMYALAERCLVPGGRLVHLYHISTSDPYWKPLFEPDPHQAMQTDKQSTKASITVSTSDIASHLSLSLPPTLRLESLSQQSLTKDRLRCLVTLTKLS